MGEKHRMSTEENIHRTYNFKVRIILQIKKLGNQN